MFGLHLLLNDNNKQHVENIAFNVRTRMFVAFVVLMLCYHKIVHPIVRLMEITSFHPVSIQIWLKI